MMTLHTILTPEWIHRGKLIAAENPRLEGFVPSEGGENPRILLLGEAPGDKRSGLVGHLWDLQEKNSTAGWRL